MRFRNGLAILERCFSNDGPSRNWVVMSYHPVWSITWTLALYYLPDAPIWRRLSLHKQKAMRRVAC